MLALPTTATSRWPGLRDGKFSSRFLIAFGLMTIIVFIYTHKNDYGLPHMSIASGTKSPSTKGSASFQTDGRFSSLYNSTLGLEKIFVLALPDRRERLSPLLDAARVTSLNLTVLNAVRDEEISRDSWPTKWSDGHSPGELGCLMSHIRTWNKMIQEGITSAMVLESDADWELRIKAIMADIPRAIRNLVDFPSPSMPMTPDMKLGYDPAERSRNDYDPQSEKKAPPKRGRPLPSEDYSYHDADENDQLPLPPSADVWHSNLWDVLWIGHCGAQYAGGSRQYAYYDVTVPPQKYEWIFDAPLSDEQHRWGTRTIFPPSHATCSVGYVITNRGAHKLVEYFKDADAPLDLQLADHCAKRAGLVCLASWPQIITAAQGLSSTIAHGGSKDNEDKNQGEVDAWDLTRERARGGGQQFSARRNSLIIMEAEWEMERWRAEWDTMWGWVDIADDEDDDDDDDDDSKDKDEDDEDGKSHELRKAKKPRRKWDKIPLNRTEAFKRFVLPDKGSNFAEDANTVPIIETPARI